MQILFCNVGWMEKYDGIDGDSIQRGGSYNKDSIGHEVCNFSNINGKVYGYVQPTGQIKIEKLGAGKKDEYVNAVTIIWTAGPDSGGTVVVGWYKNATVFRESQKIKNPSSLQKKNGLDSYRISASAADATLLPSDRRSFMIPRAVKGGIGQSNVWYADSPESEQIVAETLRLVESGGNADRIPDVDDEAHGFEGNPRLIAHLRREISIPKVLRGKMDPPWPPFNIFHEEYLKLSAEDLECVETGRIRLKGWQKTQKCYILRGGWRESRNSKGALKMCTFANEEFDFGTLVVAKNKKEAIEKIRKKIESPIYPDYKKLFTLEPALARLNFKPRGESKEKKLWKTEARRWSVFLYDWLKSEILNKTNKMRYQPINDALESFDLKKKQWKNAKTACKLAYNLVRREWPELDINLSTFEKHYISHRESRIFLKADDPAFTWAATAVKFLHKGKPELWIIYRPTGESLIIKRPGDGNIVKRKPIECRFKVFEKREWLTKQFRWEEDSESSVGCWREI